MALGLYNVGNPLDKAAAAQHGVGQTMAAMSKGGSSTTTTKTEKSGSGMMDVIGAGLAIGSMVATGGSTLGLVLGAAGAALKAASASSGGGGGGGGGGGSVIDDTSQGWFGLSGSKLAGQKPAGNDWGYGLH